MNCLIWRLIIKQFYISSLQQVTFNWYRRSNASKRCEQRSCLYNDIPNLIFWDVISSEAEEPKTQWLRAVSRVLSGDERVADAFSVDEETSEIGRDPYGHSTPSRKPRLVWSSPCRQPFRPDERPFPRYPSSWRRVDARRRGHSRWRTEKRRRSSREAVACGEPTRRLSASESTNSNKMIHRHEGAPEEGKKRQPVAAAGRVDRSHACMRGPCAEGAGVGASRRMSRWERTRWEGGRRCSCLDDPPFEERPTKPLLFLRSMDKADFAIEFLVRGGYTEVPTRRSRGSRAGWCSWIPWLILDFDGDRVWVV